MVENGHEVVAFGPEDDAPTIDALAAIGVRLVQIPMARPGSTRCRPAMPQVLYRELRRVSPDLILCYTMKPIVYGLIAARMAGIKRRHALVTGLG